MAEVSEKLLECVKGVAEREQCLLYDMEIVGAGRNRILRIFIDKSSGESVSIDDCARVSRALDLILDVEDLVPGGTYNLEVSSPGLERKLRLPWHFAQARGQKVNLQLIEPLGDIDPQTPHHESKRKKVVGHIDEASDEVVKIFLSETTESPSLSIPLAKIKKAQVVYDFESNKNKKM